MPATTNYLAPAAFGPDKADAVTVTLVFLSDYQWRIWRTIQPFLLAYLVVYTSQPGGLYLALDQGVACRRLAGT
jgi:hypothetical protein